MANSQSESTDSNVFSLRIVTVDYYMAPPIPGVDICYSTFQGEKVNEVPVIRIYGSTPAGQKACVHIHKALPYLYVPCADILLKSQKGGDACAHAIFLALERALKLKGTAASKRQHVHDCSLVRARRFYGYHEEEELFVKIYFYHPNDVSRAANLLLAGEVMERSLQPYESHIPYILQFFVDYNLHGMGYLHLLKMKFRHPVPDIVPLNSCGDAHLDSTVWLSSSVPPHWIWGFPGDYDASLGEESSSVKRQSICELEGDAMVEEILNQHFKMYTSLSQSQSDVKMVQSLIPIWEEFERTGMCVAAVPPDTGKPLPEDVLKSLSPDLELVNKFMELSREAERCFTPHDENATHMHKAASLIDDGKLNQLCRNDSPRLSGESSKIPEESVNIGPMSGYSAQGLQHDEEGKAFTNIGESVCPNSHSNDGLESMQVTGTADAKSADIEALGLLKWLATSEAAEDIDSDDDLAHETILSPLLPAKSMEKVLEKANMDYESESQKECQDILDSIKGSIDLESMEDGASQSSDHTHTTRSLLEKSIPQLDGYCDDLNSTLIVGGSSEMDMETEGKLESLHEGQQSVSTSTSFYHKNRSKKPLWGCIPFSMSEKVSDFKSINTDRNALSNNDDKDRVGTHFSGENIVGDCSDAYMRDVDMNTKEAGGLVGCSVRDLMRKKRYYRMKPSDGDFTRIKKIQLGEEKTDVYMSNSFDINGRGRVFPESPEPGTLSTDSEGTNPGFCGVRPTSYDLTTHSQLPLQPNSGSIFNYSAIRLGSCGYDTKLDYPCSSKGTSASTNSPKTQKAVRALYKEDLQHDSELKRQEHTFSCSQFDICHGIVPNSVNPPITNSEGGLHVSSMEFGSRNNKGEERMHEISSDSAARTDSSMDIITAHNETCDGGGKKGGSLSKASWKPSLVVNKDIESLDSIGPTLCKKPPIMDQKAGRSESAPLLPTISDCPIAAGSGKYKESSGNKMDDIPFFFGDCQENEALNKCVDGNDCKVLQDSAQGVRTHYQNDGSCLLTHVLSPPSVDNVTKWLLQDKIGHGNSVKKVADSDEALVKSSCPKGFESNPVASPSPSPDDCHKDLAEGESVPYKRNALDPAYEEDSEKDHFKRMLICMNASKVLQSVKDMTKVNTCTDALQDTSQISGPEGTLSNTPLSQLGFRDPASIGRGQQLTMSSIEVVAESRGDLRPDPRFDAINVVSLAIQHDGDATTEVNVLLRGYSESDNRYIDGLPGCKIFVFSEEKHLFFHFVKIMRSFDPDIIMGWDIQGASLGFLAERASHLGIGLLNKISRTPFETKLTGESAIPENEIPDILQQESVAADTGQIRDAIIEDEWGRTHASGVHVGGRIVLNIWRLVRGEVKLIMYTVEAVAEAVLRRKVPLIPPKVLTRWYSSGPARARYRCIEYVLERARLNLEIVIQLDMINRTSELARVFGIEFFSVLSRGSQYRVESMFLRLAHVQNFLAISPGNQQVASQPAMECIPLVMEPESGFYADPVVVLDFQSLYPSMIIGYNLCYCTCLGKVVPAKPNTLGVCSYSPDSYVLQKLKDQILLTPNGVMYVPSKVRRGVLPRLLEEILSTRIMVKQAMKKLAPSQQVLQKIFNARQLALKLIANVTYGYTAAGFSGRMPCAELADSIVQCGRSTLEKAISFVNSHDKWKARVIYGDTDSMFVLLRGRSVAESFQIGKEIASAITAMNPDPVTLKLEKVYQPCFLLTKKRYVGYSYESPEQHKPTFDAKGIETVRRDTCAAVSKMMEQSLRLFFEQQDLLEVKSYLQRQWTRILSGRVSLHDFVFAKEVRLGTYSVKSSSLPPAAIVATKAMRTDPRAEPRYADRVPYIVIHGEPGARLVDMVVDPLDLLAIDSPYRLNDIYYITKQIIPALQRVFGLLGADLNKWFSEMPRPVRESFSKCSFSAQNSHRTRIDYYYLSKHCILCGELVQASEHICTKCSANEIGAMTAVVGRTSSLEREMHHLNAICRHCGGGDWLVESGVKCKSLACSVLYERCKVQKELKGLSAVAAEKGFYPKCNSEWF